MSDEWGPWIEHDGKSHPHVGMYVEVEYLRECNFITGATSLGIRGRFREVIVHEKSVSFIYGNVHDESTWSLTARGTKAVPIIRYRIRKPRGMSILEEILTNLPTEVDA
jgi:hypothetical protein